jgi:hypothetical protein
VSDGRISDNEVVYRRIPLAEGWFEPPDRISSCNFKLRQNELGISVYRAAMIDVAGVLNRPEVKGEYRVAATTVGKIRAARNGKGEPLNLDVVPVNDENDPGHAEIRGRIPSGAAKALSHLFSFAESSSFSQR